MPKGQAPRRSNLYRNSNKDIITSKGRRLTSGDMRPSSPKNLRDRKQLNEDIKKKFK